MRPRKVSVCQQILEEQEKDKICSECGNIMKVKKDIKSRGNHPHIIIYICEQCGFEHRKRSFKEILRDIGEKE